MKRQLTLKFYFIITWLLFAVTLNSQEAKKGKSKKEKTNTVVPVYPAPPDTARLQFLTSFSNSSDFSGKRSGLQKSVLGEELVINIGKPYGISTSRGKVFICDAFVRGIEIVDLEKRKMTVFIPEGRGQLKLPINCYKDTTDGKLYVTDIARKELVVFSSELNYLSAIKNPDTADTFKPMDVCASADKLWVTNPQTHQVYVYNKTDFKLISKFPDAAFGDPAFLNNPINIYYRDKKIYVTDVGDFKVKIFDDTGKFLSAVGEYGKNSGQFIRPKGIAVDEKGILYAVDAGFENVQMFDGKGKLLMFFGGPYKSKGDMWLPAKVHVDYDNLSYYKKFILPDYDIEYLIYVVNQYGPDKVSVYGAIRHGSKKP